jgi:hypothetical protein
VKYVWIALLSTGVLLVFAARVFLYIEQWNEHSLVPFVQNQTKGTKVTVEGTVVEDPDQRDTTVHAVIHVVSVDGKHADGTLIAFFPPDEKLSYGEKVTAKGTLRVPDAFETETGTFD